SGSRTQSLVRSTFLPATSLLSPSPLAGEAHPHRPSGFWGPRGGGPGVLAGALLLDAVLGEGQHAWHPVALAGRALEAALAPWRRGGPAARLGGGAAAGAAGAAGAATAAWALERLARRAGPAGWLAQAVALKPTFAVRQLLEEGLRVAGRLEEGRLADA